MPEMTGLELQEKLLKQGYGPPDPVLVSRPCASWPPSASYTTLRKRRTEYSSQFSIRLLAAMFKLSGPNRRDATPRTSGSDSLLTSEAEHLRSTDVVKQRPVSSAAAMASLEEAHNEGKRSMEHRLSQRIAVTIPVSLHYRNGAYDRGLVLNLSAGGLFVQPLTRSSHRGCVDLHMTAPCSSGDCTIRLPSLIVHQTKTGIGLMFLDLDELAEAAVLELLRHEPGVPLNVDRPPTPADRATAACLQNRSR